MPAKSPPPTTAELVEVLDAHHPGEAEQHRVLAEIIEAHKTPETSPLALQRARLVAQLRGDAYAVAGAYFLQASDEERQASLTATAFDPEQHTQKILEASSRILSTQWDDLSAEDPESLRRMVVAMAADARVLLVVLAQRVLMIESNRDRPPAQAQKIATQTLEIFAPLANRLGVWQIKWRLEDLALRTLQPEIYQQLKTLIAQTRKQRDAFIELSQSELQGALDEAGIKARITGRPKHIYSIYNKMRRKNIGFDEIYDISALRVIVDTVAECYAVLGLIHGRWTPIPGEFDDYIARPKGNMYQSLHTAVHGPSGRSLEVQIRTQQMHEFAEFGVAAHWSYKEGNSASRSDQKAARQFDVLHQLMDWQQQIEDHEGFAQALRSELFSEQVYVFTPKGDVLAFPRGATPLDFAYRVHTQVGHRCRGAKINDRIVPLQTALQTGDHIEILTQKQPAPSRDWLHPQSGYVMTAGARQKIRQWFRQQGRQDAIDEGRTLFSRTLDKLSLSEVTARQIAKRLEYSSEDELFAALGFSDLSTHRVATIALELESPPEKAEPEPTSTRRSSPSTPRSAKGVRISGMGEIMSQPANCCLPLPGDEVIGFMSRGRGITLHRRDCSNAIARQQPERWIEIEWGSETQQSGYPTQLQIETLAHSKGSKLLSEAMAQYNLEARSFEVAEGDDDTQIIRVELRVKNHEQLLDLIHRLEQRPEVLAVRRIQR